MNIKINGFKHVIVAHVRPVNVSYEFRERLINTMWVTVKYVQNKMGKNKFIKYKTISMTPGHMVHPVHRKGHHLQCDTESHDKYNRRILHNKKKWKQNSPAKFIMIKF